MKVSDPLTCRKCRIVPCREHAAQVRARRDAGQGLEQAEAAKCTHERFAETARTVEVGAGLLLVVEKCAGCVAVRGRARAATPAELEEWVKAHPPQ